MKRFPKRMIPPLVCCAAFAAQAVDVYVTEQTSAGGTVTELKQTVAATGVEFTTQIAPDIDGYIFTHWSISAKQTYSTRDILGRTYDALPFMVYEDTTATANYVPSITDEDADGIADGYELYWYGDFSKDGTSDTDNDGLTFAEELAAGTSPILADNSLRGGVAWSDSELHQYNPNGLKSYTIRSEPEGELFETITDYAKEGVLITSPTGDVSTTSFAYWTMNGKRVTDLSGRAVDTVIFTMPNEPVELVAHTAANAAERFALYWYGNVDVAQDSDTDQDGYTFAQELASGTSPLLADRSLRGGVAWADSELHQYNPDNVQRYVIRSEPEGSLFETISDYAKIGSKVTSPIGDRDSTIFAYWTMNGERVTDLSGRAVDTVTFTMPETVVELIAHTAENETDRALLYWYGTTEIAEDSDTDGDGYTFAQELAAGTSPLLADRSLRGGVAWADSSLADMNLQVYEEEQGALMDGMYRPLFTSPIAGNGAQSEVFANGSQIWPVVVDLNDDGKKDLVVFWGVEELGVKSGGVKSDAESGGVESVGMKIYLNVGTKSNPDLKEDTEGVYKDRAMAWVGMNSTNKLQGLTFDVVPENALSATVGDVDNDGVSDLLVSDVDGRIWCYKGNGEQGTGNGESRMGNGELGTGNGSLGTTSPTRYVLQHKVWGGSYEGFAKGLMLAAVDWDDDGDLDCVCGTAEGRLMLLTDPRGGRPSNVSLAAGADSVSIKWDPNAQSRIRGYYVYRRAQNGNWSRLEATTLPRFLDKPPEGTDSYDYRVTSVSRFYTTGNSKPTTVESAATETMSATLAKVAFTWRPAAGFAGDDVTVDFAVENALNLSAENLVLRISYDPAVLVPVEVVRSGLTESLEFTETRGSGSWLISGTGGTIAAGSGKFLSFSFAVADGKALADVKVTVEEFTLKSVANRNVIPEVLKGSGDLNVEVEDPDDAAQVPAGSQGDLDEDGRLGWNDVELFLKWKDAPSAEIPEGVRRAGDYNGDGRMDNRDYILMRRHYRVREKRGGRMTGWDKNHNHRGERK